MNNSWWQELMHFFLQGMTLKQLIHMLIILIMTPCGAIPKKALKDLLK